MKQLFQWPDINVLTESAWQNYEWPLIEDLNDEDLDAFDKKYSGIGADFNVFMSQKRVAPALFK